MTGKLLKHDDRYRYTDSSMRVISLLVAPGAINKAWKNYK